MGRKEKGFWATYISPESGDPKSSPKRTTSKGKCVNIRILQLKTVTIVEPQTGVDKWAC